MNRMRVMSIAALLTVGAVVDASATQTVRELWDNVFTSGSDRPINQVADGPTSRGFAPGVNWYLNMNTPLPQVAQNFNVNGAPGLPNNAGQNAAVWSQCFLSTATYTNLGFYNEPNNGPTMDPRHWGVRQLTADAQIDFNADGVYWFSLQANHAGTGCQGIGFATGTNSSSRFVGAGLTWASYQTARLTNEFGMLDIGNTIYISTGTLDQTDPDMYYPVYPVLGPCYVQAYATNSLNIDTGVGLVLGRLTTRAGGNATLDVAWIPTGQPVPATANDVVWDTTYNFTETSLMDYLLFWQDAYYNVWPYPESDGIRVGTRYVDVVGLENISLAALPASTNFAGTAVSLWSTNASTGEAPSFQWRKDGVALSDVAGSISNSVGVAATANLSRVRLSLLNPVPSDSGDYDVILSNSFGMVTSSVTHVEIQPTAPPQIVTQPQPATRYVHGYKTFGVELAGTPPYTFQWQHAGTNLPGATSQALQLSDIQLSAGGDYQVWVTNSYGWTNSAFAALTVVPLAPGSYAEAVMDQQPFAFWPLNETDSSFTHDYAGGHNGAIGVTNDGSAYLATQQGVVAPRNPPFPGFSADNTGMAVTNGWDNELNGGVIILPVTNMTIVGWIYPYGNQVASAGLIMSREGTSETTSYFGMQFIGQNADGRNVFTFHWPLADGTAGITGSDPTGDLIDPVTYMYVRNPNMYVPTNQWTFVAMAVNPTNVSLYVGNGGTLYHTDHNSVTDPAMGSVTEFTPLGAYACPWPLEFGRDDIPWAHRTDRNFDGRFDSVALFGKTLTAAELQAIYQAGAGTGVRLYATPDPTGTTISWNNGLLMSGPSVTGPFQIIDGAISPYLTVPNTGAMQFYRVSVTDTNGVKTQ